jgi:hypothetical protein
MKFVINDNLDKTCDEQYFGWKLVMDDKIGKTYNKQ